MNSRHGSSRKTTGTARCAVQASKVLVLQDGRSGDSGRCCGAHQLGEARSRGAACEVVPRLQTGAHPTKLLIGTESCHGTNRTEAYVDTTSVSVIRKATILRQTGC